MTTPARATIVVLAPTLRGSGHSVLNAGILVTLHRAFPEASIRFVAEAAHMSQVRAHLSPSEDQAIVFAADPLPAPLLKERSQRQAVKLLTDLLAEPLAATGGCYIISTSIHGAMVHVLRAVATGRIACRQRVWTHFFLHGPDRGDLTYRSRNPLVRWWDLQSAVARFTAGQARYLVLDAATIPAWAELSPGLAEKLLALDIAVLPSEAGPEGPCRVLSRPVRFGLVGQATEAKGFSFFRELAAVAEAQAPGLAEFHLVGRLSTALAGADPGRLIFHSRQAQVSGEPAAHMDRPT